MADTNIKNVVTAMSQPPAINKFYRDADRFFLTLSLALLALSFGLASWNGTWAEAFLVGVPAVAVPAMISKAMPGHRLTRISFAASLMVFSALHIHQAHGLIEMHFGIFALLAALLYYRDQLTIITAAAVIAIHHLVFNYLQEMGSGVYIFEYHPGLDMTTGLEIVLLHAAFVVFEAGVLVYLSRKSWAEFLQSVELLSIGEHLQKEGQIDLSYQLDKPQSAFGHTFNTFFAQINELVNEARELSYEISGISDDFDKSCKTVESGSSKQSDETDLIASATQEMTSAMEEINRFSDEAAKSATSATEVSAASDKEIRAARTSIERLEQNIKTANTVIENLDSESNNIGSVLSVIQGIAEQTNLLALNAAIEAARAGEQGRGFAVVADEVRTLASRTHESTEEIQRMIEQLQKGSGEAVSAMETSLSGVGESVSQIGHIDEQLRLIKSAVESMSTMNQQIAQAIREQNLAVNEVNGNIISIREIGDANLGLAQASKAKTGRLSNMAGKLAGLLAKFKTH
jgi:methyl-accepting chemotaxis protein